MILLLCLCLCVCIDDGFSDWCGTFDVQAHQAAISSLLVSCSNVRSLHARLVPGQVSYEAFWMRYFYKVELMQQVSEQLQIFRLCNDIHCTCKDNNYSLLCCCPK